jgi:hypothetical protein
MKKYKNECHIFNISSGTARSTSRTLSLKCLKVEKNHFLLNQKLPILRKLWSNS